MISKLSVVLQALIIVLLAIVIALVIYYGTNPPKNIKAPGSIPSLQTVTSPSAHHLLD